MPLFSTLVAAPAIAMTLSCLVVQVEDGDTLSADCAPRGVVLQTEQRPRRDDGGTYTAAVGSAKRYRIRLSKVDAPEDGQPFGDESRDSLKTLCLQKKATIWFHTTDRYGRHVARVVCEGRDAGSDQVRTGMAWVFERYSKDPILLELQAKTKANRTGLWVDPEPVPPWEWRPSMKQKK